MDNLIRIKKPGSSDLAFEVSVIASKFGFMGKNIRYKIKITPEKKIYADIVFAIDCSESMYAIDPGREVRKQSIIDFIEEFKDHFTANGLQVSFICWSSQDKTKHSKFASTYLEAKSLIVNMMSGMDIDPATDFSCALDTAVKMFNPELTEKARSIVIITDGQRDCGGIDGFNLVKSTLKGEEEKIKGVNLYIIGIRVPPGSKRVLSDAFTEDNCIFIEDPKELSSTIINLSDAILHRLLATDVVLTYVLPRYINFNEKKESLPSYIETKKKIDGTETITWKVDKIRSGDPLEIKFKTVFNPRNALLGVIPTKRESTLIYKIPYGPSDSNPEPITIKPKTINDLEKPPFWSRSRWI